MKLRIVAVTRGREPWADMAAEIYLARLRKYVSVEEVRIRPGNREGVQEEGARLLGVLGADDRLVALDERGPPLDSFGFAKVLQEDLAGARGRLVLALGGAHGHGEAVRARAHRLLSLSPLVLNHQVARVVLLEQVYRAFTILGGEPYHH